MKAARGRVLVRPVATAETLPGGRIIIPQASREKLAAHQMIVVDVGRNEACDDDDCERPHYSMPGMTGMEREPQFHPRLKGLELGAWVYIRPRSLVDVCHETEKLYVIRQADVLCVITVLPDPERSTSPA